MKVAHRCTYCDLNSDCDCQRSIASLFKILVTVDQRVSTLKPTSDLDLTEQPKVTIDKLIFEILSPIHIDDIKRRLRTAGIAGRMTKHSDHRWCIQVGTASSGMYLRLMSKTHPYSRQLVSRPSAFVNFAAYMKQLGQILNQDEIDSMRITRLDLAIDYKEQLSAILRGFDFKRKQVQVAFTDLNGQRTGLRIGKGTEKIQVYDKAIESNLPGPLTRIEVQLSGRKLPSRSLEGLKTTLSKKGWSPFSQISLNDIRFPDESTVLTESQKKRLLEITPILNREGLFSAKRVFNEQGNFHRDYQSIIHIQPKCEQPDAAFRKQFSTYFNEERKGDNDEI